MTTFASDDERTRLRRAVYGLLIVISASIIVGRIMTVQSARGKTPMLSANDRSRWATIRALVDEGTYEIDRVIFRAPGKRDPDWYTIDLVKHKGPDGREHYYSSKPTLLSTLIAPLYWLLKQAAGVTLAARPFYVIRILLLLLNVVPWIGCLWLLAQLVERLGRSDWARLFVMAVAAFATPLSTFAVTLNNHSPAAFGVIVAVWSLLVIWRNPEKMAPFFTAGTAAAFAAANELPALSFFALTCVAAFWQSPKRALLGFLPPAASIAALALITNYVAHGTWTPPYAHRQDGPVAAQIDWPASALPSEGRVPEETRNNLATAGIRLSENAVFTSRPQPGKWMVWDPQGEMRYAAELLNGQLVLRHWDHWYEYEGTYWLPAKKRGVDRGEASKLVYAFHALLGHHGVLSLTPVWLLSICGAAVWLARGGGPQQYTGNDRNGLTTANRKGQALSGHRATIDKLSELLTEQRAIALAAIALTTVCLVFYILLRGVEDRNYGGVSCCFRWLVWLTPLWILCLLPAADAVARRRALRWLALLLLAISIFSATYNAQNPWSHPWLFDYWTHLGWIRY